MDNFELVLMKNGELVWRSGIKSTQCETYTAGQTIDLTPLGYRSYRIDEVVREIAPAESPTISEGLLFRTILKVSENPVPRARAA